MRRRPLRPEERAALVPSLDPRGSLGDVALAAGLTFGAVLGFFLIVLPGSWQYGTRSLAPAAVAVWAAIVIARRVRNPRRPDPWAEALREDLEGGEVAVESFRVVDAFGVPEVEDEGSQYFLILEDDEVLFLAGQYLYEAEDSGAFPSSRITVERLPRSRVVLDLRCEGDPLPVSARMRPFTTEEYESGHVPEDGELVDRAFLEARR